MRYSKDFVEQIILKIAFFFLLLALIKQLKMSKESRSSFDLISHNIKTCAGLINGTENNFLPFKRLTSQTSEGVLWYQTLRSYML